MKSQFLLESYQYVKFGKGCILWPAVCRKSFQDPFFRIVLTIVLGILQGHGQCVSLYLFQREVFHPIQMHFVIFFQREYQQADNNKQVRKFIPPQGMGGKD